jgi:hypothetical protein
MQVYLDRTELPKTQPWVITAFPEFPVLDRNLLGTTRAVISLPQSAVIYDTNTRRSKLTTSWRTDNATQIVNDEGQRRIIESFSEYMQRNALRAVQYYTNLQGTNVSLWDPANRAIHDTAEAGWVYVAAVRNRADSLVSALPVDPTDDANWPARIAVVYIPPV